MISALPSWSMSPVIISTGFPASKRLDFGPKEIEAMVLVFLNVEMKFVSLLVTTTSALQSMSKSAVAMPFGLCGLVLMKVGKANVMGGCCALLCDERKHRRRLRQIRYNLFIFHWRFN